jgi:hypothetical protein
MAKTINNVQKFEVISLYFQKYSEVILAIIWRIVIFVTICYAESL